VSWGRNPGELEGCKGPQAAFSEGEVELFEPEPQAVNSKRPTMAAHSSAVARRELTDSPPGLYRSTFDTPLEPRSERLQIRYVRFIAAMISPGVAGLHAKVHHVLSERSAADKLY